MKTLPFFLMLAVACGQPSKSKTVTIPAEKPLGEQMPDPAPAPAPQYPAPVPEAPAPEKPQAEPPKAPEPTPQPQPQPGSAPAPCGPVVTAPCAPQGGGPVVTVPVPVFTGGIPVTGNGQDCYRVSLDVCELENEVAGAINGFRTARGLMPLFGSYQIGYTGRRWSAQMAASGTLAVEHPAFFVDQLNLGFGPSLVLIGNGNAGGVIQAMSVATVPLTAALEDVTGAAVLNALLTNSETAIDLVYPGFRAFGVGIVSDGANLWVTVLYTN